MNILNSLSRSEPKSTLISEENGKDNRQAYKPLVSLIVPAFNEAVLLGKNLATLCHYMESLEHQYRWEMIVVNDGSSDETGKLAESFAKSKNNVHVLHHSTNFGLGQAFKSAFNQCHGDYVVTLDVDLSYSPDHIGQLLAKIRETRAKLVLASPYMKGGSIANVPWLRRTLSIWANRFLSLFAQGHLSTLTCMVRAYDGEFLRSLNLRSMDMEVMPETIYKAMILRARIEQVPATLDWGLQMAEGVKRRSSMRVLRHIISTLLSGFIFRPFMFFIIPGLALFLVSFYAGVWMLIHVFTHFQTFPQYTWLPSRLSAAVAAAYSETPHAFFVSGMALMLSIQLISLGILALQSKNYFEEIFHLGSRIYRLNREDGKDRS